MLLQVGPLRLALLDATDGSKLKTLYLPAPDKDGLSLEWEKVSSSVTLLDGSPRCRVLGYVPTLKAKWGVYYQGGLSLTVGTADGQTPGLEDLLLLLSQPSGLLKVSPGLTTGGFVVDSVDVAALGVKGSFPTGLQITLKARHALPTRSLGVF